MSRNLITNDALAIQWMAAFGYDTITQFQTVSGLEVTGRICTETMELMSRPRCGVKDFATAGDCRWRGKTHLQYYHGRGFNLFKRQLKQGGRKTSADMLAEGFAAWAQVTQFTFSRTSDPEKADIRIGGGRGHKYGFDGPGNVLAWAYMPCGSFNFLETRFDVDERWTHNSSLRDPWIGAYPVWLHELGHCLGLGHSHSDQDLMAPYYNPALSSLQPGDIQRIQTLYA